MPTATNHTVDPTAEDQPADPIELYYETAGDGDPVAFVPTLGFGAWQWAWQHGAITGPFQTIVYHGRGTGESSSAPGPWSVQGLAADLEAVLTAAAASRVHLVGFGLGGMVALAYAREYNRARSLTLIGTTPGGDEADRPVSLAETLGRHPGDEQAISASMDHAFSSGFQDARPDLMDRVLEWRQEEDATIDDWEAGEAAYTDYERDVPLYEVDLPTLVFHGEDDTVVPVSNAETLGEELPRATVETFPGAGHCVHIERSQAVNDRLFGFLTEYGDPAV